MAASKLSSLTAMAAATASFSTFSNRAFVEAPFRFSPFSSLSQTPPKEPSNSEPKSDVEESKGGFDPESLERGAKALREINSFPYSKQVFEVMRKQEQSRLRIYSMCSVFEIGLLFPYYQNFSLQVPPLDEGLSKN